MCTASQGPYNIHYSYRQLMVIQYSVETPLRAWYPKEFTSSPGDPVMVTTDRGQGIIHTYRAGTRGCNSSPGPSVSWVVTLQALYLSVYPSLVLYDTYSGCYLWTVLIRQPR